MKGLWIGHPISSMKLGWVNPIIKRFMAPLTVHVRYSFYRGVGFYAETFHGANRHCGNACENMTVLYWLNTSGMKIVIKHKIDSIRQNPEQILQLHSGKNCGQVQSFYINVIWVR